MGVMIYEVLKNNLKSKYRPDLKDNFTELLEGLESFIQTSESVKPVYGPLNFSRLEYTIPKLLIRYKPTAKELEAMR